MSPVPSSLRKASGAVRAVLVAGVGAGLVLGAGQVTTDVQLTAAPGNADTQTTTPQPEPIDSSAVVCPGPEARGVDGVPAWSQTVGVSALTAPADVLPRDARPSGAGGLALRQLPGHGTATTLDTRGQSAQPQLSSATSLLLSGTGALAPGLVASQSALVTSGTHRMLSLTACTAPGSDEWLVGGGAGAGRQEYVVLSNPGPNALTVDLQVLGAHGPVDSPNGHGIVVAPYGRTVVLLDSIAGEENSPVVHVTAQGGDVVAALADSWLDGTVPRGGDTTSPAAPPAKDQVIPALSRGAGPAGATVRVAVPGDTEAVVQVRVLTDKGPRRVKHDVTRVPAHSVADIDVADLPAGTYAVQVQADEPVVAGAWAERRDKSGAPADFAWMPAAGPVTSLAGLPLQPHPPGSGTVKAPTVSSSLVLSTVGDPATVQVTTVGRNGKILRTSSVKVGTDSSTVTQLGDAASVWVQPLHGRVRAGIVATASTKDGGLVAEAPLNQLPLTHVPTPIRQVGE